ncbi:MAG: sugar phosphate nucleotidyltransferase, partial [Methylocella sp.]
RFWNGLLIFVARERENVKILPVIMCGGTGTRVWPESRESLPKQFISLVGPLSTFQIAAEMLADGVFETPIVISNHDYRFLVAEQLQKIKREARIVLAKRGCRPLPFSFRRWFAPFTRRLRPTPFSR